jgi:hypothetical protein
MEDWDFNLFFEEPDDWFTLNTVLFLLDPGTVSVSKSSDAYSGNYSAKLITKAATVSEQEVVVPSILTLAEFHINMADTSFGFSGGYFLQENVHKLTGWYKYEGLGEDSATVLMYNYKNNGGIMDTIGYGFSVLGNTTEWQPFEVYMQNLSYFNKPDTFNVFFSSSKTISAMEGSTLLIDSISIYTNTGIIDLWSPKKPLQVYPNPALDYITFNTEKRENNRILTIYNNFGKPIIKKDFPEQTITLNLSDIVSGIYTYKLSKGNTILNSGSFIKN